MTCRLVTVQPTEAVSVAIARMREVNVGSVAVCDGPSLVGIFTERDLVRIASEGPHFADVHIEGDDAPARDRVGRRRHRRGRAPHGERRIRHLPVVQDGMLLGVVGIRDVMGSLLELVWRERDGRARDTARELLRR